MAYLFVAPVLIHILVFTAYPFFSSLYFSFTKYNVLSPAEWRGLDNYQRLIQSRIFWIALKNTLYYGAVTMPLKMAFGLLLAVLLNQGVRGISLFRALYYAPVVTAMVAVALAWERIYHPNQGLINMALRAVGLPRQMWLQDPKLALPSLMILGVWKWVGSTMVIYLAGLQGIPAQFYEAAAIDGASKLRQFWHVTLPLLKPVTFFIFVTQTISSFSVFAQVYVLTQGGPGFATTTIMYEIFEEAFQKFHMGYASAMAFVVFAMIMALTVLNIKLGSSRARVEY
jgi:ABC-type sugar transport system permease subunit